MINTILPLIYDYLDIPFELNKVCRQVRKNSKKYSLTLITGKRINKNILKVFRWKYLNLKNDESITDGELKFIPNIQWLHLHFNRKITDEGLKHIPNIQSLDLYFNKNITDDGLKYIR